jgi:PKD repeat protein
MYRTLLFPLLTLAVFFCNAQSPSPCGFDTYLRQHTTQVLRSEKIIQKWIINSSELTKETNGLKIIPVVVHIIHDGGIENISDDQVQSQIDVLNEDYRKIPGTNGDGNGVDTEIEFCLAQLDPDGDCTNGIVRIQSDLTYHDSYERPQLSELSSWDPARYVNIYVVKTIAGNVLGYASFPGGPVDQDGIVMAHYAFGTIGTVTAPYHLGRTSSHELGHWFGLYHTFNGGCGVDTCSDGDYVCDTPPVVNPNFGCPVINTCHNDLPDVNDQVENYLDYTNDDCKSMFTQGQKDRMHAVLDSLRFDIWQLSNITTTGCDSNYISPVCNVVADFTANAQAVCIGNEVLFTNKTLNSPVSFQWYFQGGTPSSSTDLNPQISYDTLGTFDVTLIAFGFQGNDTLLFSDYINVTVPQAGQPLPFYEGFESPTFPPNGIVIENPDNGITWERDTIAVQYAGLASAKINNFININYGQSDAMVLPAFDFTTATNTPFLSFKWAYAKSDVNYTDELIVLVSSDCGVNFSQVFYKAGSALTTGPTQTTPYIPDSNTIWKSANISLANYEDASRVIVKIINVTDGGNNLYIDEINFGDQLTVIEDVKDLSKLSIYPNPASESIVIENLPTASAIQLSLKDQSGRILYKDNSQGISNYNLTFPKNLPDGLYFLECRSTQFKRVIKVIIASGK